MSTIPTTSKRTSTPYTVVGGARSDRERSFPLASSLLLLNRGGRLHRQAIFEELERLELGEIISIEGPSNAYDIEALSQSFPHVRFLVLHEEASRGEQINIAMEEARGLHVLVLWSDVRVAAASLPARTIERMRDTGLLCAVPIVQNARLENVPTIMAPALHGNSLKVLALQPTADGMMSLFPFDYCGIYEKERFVLVGGYDRGLKNPYWQKMDFGFRSYMWGERIACSTSFRVAYQGEPISEDTTPDESYKQFFLKNLSIRFAGDSGALPISRFFSYFPRAGGVWSALREFRSARRWVEVNRFRFKQDARSVTELWEVPEP